MPIAADLVIRPMLESDLDAVLAIEQSSFSAPWKREHFQHEISAAYSFPFVAEFEGVIDGYVCLMLLFEEAQILDIAVAIDQRGNGIARCLMDHAFTRAKEKGAEVMSLEVRYSNSSAIALYERLGFQRCGKRARYYEGVEDALLMEKSLKGES